MLSYLTFKTQRQANNSDRHKILIVQNKSEKIGNWFISQYIKGGVACCNSATAGIC